ncbi:MAG: DddA-like double-stranded DNA deaminase toxin [Actinocatenispora sp.]
MGEVAAAIRAVIEQINQTHRLLGTVQQRLDTTTGSIASTVAGTTNTSPSGILAAVQSAAHSLTTSQAQLATCVSKLDQYLTDVGADPPSPVAPPGPARPTIGHPPPREDTPTPVAAPIGRRPPPARQPYGVGIPEHVDEAGRELPARRPDNEAWSRQRLPEPTAGIATNDDEDNTSLGGVITSGLKGPNAGAPGLKRFPAIRWGTNLSHVEAHTAAMMRADRSLRNVTLTINNEPCNPSQPLRSRSTGRIARDQTGNIQYKQNTCHEQLEAMIPKGARLTVFVADGPNQQVRRWATYTGTGEGILE